MYKCIQKPTHHTQAPKNPEHSPMNQFGSLLTLTYRSLPNWQGILRKTSSKGFLNEVFHIGTAGCDR